MDADLEAFEAWSVGHGLNPPFLVFQTVVVVTFNDTTGSDLDRPGVVGTFDEVLLNLIAPLEKHSLKI